MSDLLVEIFSSRVRAAVLAHLLPRPHLGLSLTDLARRLDLPISSLQHECYKLTRLGVLRDQRAGASRLYRPAPTWPLLPSLTSLVGGAIGPEAAVTGAIEAVPGLSEAIVAGPLPASPTEQVYLILVGDLSIEEVDAIFARVSNLLSSLVGSQQLELAFFRPDDWRTRMAQPADYWSQVLAGPTVRVRAASERSRDR
jgi:DNA-binding transcriptional ArsR family regulator